MKTIQGFIKNLKIRFAKLSLKIQIIFLVFVLGLGWLAYSRLFPASPKTAYQTAQVTRESIIESVTQSGNVASDSQTNIGSPTNGVISDVYVKNGDSVTAGQNLFSVASTATPQEQAAAYAGFLNAQNGLNSAKSKMNSLQAALFKANQAFVSDRGILNPSDQQKADAVYIEEKGTWLQAEADYNNQAGVIAAQQASYNNASLTYAATQDSIVTAPIAGTIANFSSGKGSNVTATGTTYNNSNASSNSASSNSSPVLIIGDFSKLIIKTSVSEVDISKVKKAQKATITLDAYPDRTYVGMIDSVDTIGTNTSGVVTFNAYISFVSPPPTIHPGMSASAVVQIDRRDNALIVPSTAIQTSTEASTVRVLKNGVESTVTVETGISSDTSTEILSGLSEGDTIVTGNITTSTSTQGASPFGGLNRGFGGFSGGSTRGGGR